MFEPVIVIAFVFVAGIWGYILLTLAGNNRKFLEDDLLCANEKQRKEAKSTLRIIRLMAPVWITVVAVVIMFMLNAYFHFLRFSPVGLALIAGGLFFAYLGWAIGTALKEDKFFSRAFKLSFMIPGFIIAAIGFMICISPIAAFF